MSGGFKGLPGFKPKNLFELGHSFIKERMFKKEIEEAGSAKETASASLAEMELIKKKKKQGLGTNRSLTGTGESLGYNVLKETLG